MRGEQLCSSLAFCCLQTTQGKQMLPHLGPKASSPSGWDKAPQGQPEAKHLMLVASLKAARTQPRLCQQENPIWSLAKGDPGHCVHPPLVLWGAARQSMDSQGWAGWGYTQDHPQWPSVTHNQPQGCCHRWGKCKGSKHCLRCHPEWSSCSQLILAGTVGKSWVSTSASEKEHHLQCPKRKLTAWV